MPTNKPAYIEESCLVVMIASCLETPHKETGGFLIGKGQKGRLIFGQRMDCLTLNTAYPVLTQESGHDYWLPGNLSAYNRITDSIRSMGLDLVGEYHSHIGDGSKLSIADKRFIQDEHDRFRSKGFEVSNWIEIVLNISEKRYSRKQARSFGCHLFRNRIRITLKGFRDPRIGYSVTIAAYWFDHEKVAFQEAPLYLP